MVLYFGCDDVLDVLLANCASKRCIVGFGPTGGEKNLCRAYAQQLRNFFSGSLQGGPNLSAMRMDGGWIALMLQHVRCHGIKNGLV